MRSSPASSDWDGKKGENMTWNRSFELVEAEPHDVSFVVRGPTVEAVFENASEALLAATLKRPESVQDGTTDKLTLIDDTFELLLARFLNELMYLRETRGVLLRARSVQLQLGNDVRLESDLTGEVLTPARHQITHDVKAALAHTFQFSPERGGWEAVVSLDA
jgi:SHS2 domain-containing protein